MNAESWYAVLLIAVIAFVTLVIRAAPFVLFPADRPTPGYVLYLGKVLPSAVIGMLIVYCLKGVSLTAAPYGAPEAIALFAVIGLHLWKKNTLLSIAAGTVTYMLLINLVF